MNSESRKAEIFLENINRDADAVCDKIRRETDELVAAELSKVRIRAKEDLKALQKSETDRLNEETNAGFSEFEAAETKAVLDRRTEITNEIFSRAEAGLVKFAKSEKYLPFLKGSIEKIKKALGDDTVIILKPDDKKYEAELSELCGKIKYDESIKIGGCKAENLKNRLIADDTLEIRLEEEKENFYRTSGLTIAL